MIVSVQLNLFDQNKKTEVTPWVLSIGNELWDKVEEKPTSFSLINVQTFATKQDAERYKKRLTRTLKKTRVKQWLYPNMKAIEIAKVRQMTEAEIKLLKMQQEELG